MKKTLILAILAVFGLSFVSTTYAGTVNEAGLDWFNDMAEAKEAAQKADKHIYIYFTGGVRCGWCVKMKKETFSNPDIQKNVLSKYVIAMLNTWDYTGKPAKQADKDLMAKFGGRGVPFNVILDKNLNLVGKFSGFKTPEAFPKAIDTVFETYKELLELLKLVEKKSERNYENFYKICMFYKEKIGDLEKTIEYAKKLLKNDTKNKHKKNLELSFIIVESLIPLKQADDIKKYIKEVKKLDKKNKEGFYEKVIQLEMFAFINAKEWDKAIAVYNKFLKSKIKFHKDHQQTTKWYVAFVYISKKDTDNAKKLLQEVIDIDANTPIGKRAAYELKKLGVDKGF